LAPMPRAERPKIDPILLAILLAGLAIRVGYLIYYRSLPTWDQLTVDNYYHLHWAQVIASGNWLGDTTFFRAPLYVYLLGGLYRLLGDSLWVGRLFGLVIGAASLTMTFLIARRIFTRRTALVAVSLQALCPIMIYFEGELLLDALFTLLVQIVLYRTILWLERPTPHRMFWVGIALGVAAITRPTALVIVIALLPFLVGMVKGWPSRFKNLAALALGAALLIGPVFVRNMIVAGDPVMIASQGGINFYIGNNPSADGLSATLPEPLGFNWRMSDVTSIAEKETGKSLKPGEVSAYWSHQAWRWIAEHPVSAATLYLKKFYFSFADKEISNNRNLSEFFASVPLLRFNPLTFAPLLGLALIGLVLTIRSNRSSLLLGLSVLVLSAANSVFFVNSRFRLPVIPILIILGALALAVIAESIRRREWQKAVLPLGVSLVIALLCHLDFVSLPRGTAAQELNSRTLYFYSLNDLPRALACGRDAATQDATFPEVNLNLGNIWLRAGHSDSAEYYYRREIAAHPDRAKGYTNLASLEHLNRADDSAQTLINRALELQPADPIVNALAIRISSARRDIPVDSLKLVLTEGAARSHNDPRVLTEAGSALVQRDMLSEAEPLLLRAISAHPPAVETDDAAFDREFVNSRNRFEQRKGTAYYLLGFIAGRAGQYDDAVRYSREAIQRDSLLPQAYVNLVSGFLSQGHVAAADSTLTLALTRFPDDPNLTRLAQSMAQMKRDR
jgi:4-amino-4-deoxy-L-arabinose transferase-like glycosyltransferase